MHVTEHTCNHHPILIYLTAVYCGTEHACCTPVCRIDTDTDADAELQLQYETAVLNIYDQNNCLRSLHTVTCAAQS